MKFGILYEHQLPRPRSERSEDELLQNSLDEIELGIDKPDIHEAGQQPDLSRSRSIPERVGYTAPRTRIPEG